jgi:transcriptional regulator with XRE-family HTH domain
MDHEEFKRRLSRLGLSQVEFAKLVDVTPRAVNTWAIGDRSVPGPAAAYLNLFEQAPPALRAIELARAKETSMNLREGMFLLQFTGMKDWGAGVLILENGIIYGADIGRVLYDGTYEFDASAGLIRGNIHVRIPPGTTTVQGTKFPYEIAFDVPVSFPRDADDYAFQIKTPIGPVNARIQFLRRIPNAA